MGGALIRLTTFHHLSRRCVPGDVVYIHSAGVVDRSAYAIVIIYTILYTHISYCNIGRRGVT